MHLAQEAHSLTAAVRPSVVPTRFDTQTSNEGVPAAGNPRSDKGVEEPRNALAECNGDTALGLSVSGRSSEDEVAGSFKAVALRFPPLSMDDERH